MGKDKHGRELGIGISQRSNGSYMARATINNKQICLYNNSIKELRKEFEKAKAEAFVRAEAEANSLTLGEWFDDWFVRYKEQTVKVSSAIVIKRRAKRIFKQAFDINLRDLCNIHLQDCLNSMKSIVATGELRSGVSTITECLESAKNNRYIDINPAFNLIVPWHESIKQERRFLTPDEVKEFLDQAEHSFYKEMFYIMFFTGMRIGEVGGLQWGDINFDKKMISIKRSLSCQYYEGTKVQILTQPKTINSYRDIPFLGNVEHMLLSWKEKQEHRVSESASRRKSKDLGDLVFTTQLGSPVTRYVAEREINLIVKEINITRTFNRKEEFERVYPHAIRHTFCSMCFGCGMDPKVVQTIMGHSSYSTTIDIYTHLTKEKVLQDVSKIVDFISILK